MPEHFEDEVELGGFFGCEFLGGKLNSGEDDTHIYIYICYIMLCCYCCSMFVFV